MSDETGAKPKAASAAKPKAGVEPKAAPKAASAAKPKAAPKAVAKPKAVPVARAAGAENRDRPPFPDLGQADGPWSIENAPSDQPFISFGPLKIPAFPTLFVEIAVDPASRKAAAVSVALDSGSVEFKLIAAPRGGGLWSDLRRAIAREASAVGGTSQAVEGEFGTELIVTRPLPINKTTVSKLVSRCIGIEGDRWLLRATVGSPDALSDECVRKVNAFVSRCAVDRGDDPYGPGVVMALAFPQGGATLAIGEGV